MLFFWTLPYPLTLEFIEPQVAFQISHVTCLMSNGYVDPWDMLNNFCFNVYSQMSLFMGENDNEVFLPQVPLLSLNKS